MLAKHEADKINQAQILAGHLAGQRILQKLENLLGRKAKREAVRQLAAAETTAYKQEHVIQEEATRHKKSGSGSHIR